MKRFIKTALTVVLAVAAVSCAKELEPQKENINGTIDLTITGAINGYTPQEETKAEAQTVVRIMWKGGEKVYVFDGTECLGSLTASIEGTDGTYAKLSGTISATQATTLTFVYSPQFTAQPTVTEGKISLDLSTQNGEEVPFLIYATLPTAQTQDPTSFTNEVVQFNLATSVFKCNCAGLVGEGEISQAAISGVNTKCELALSDNGAPEVSGTTPGTITRTAGFKADDQRAIFSVALPKTDESAQDRTIEVTKGRKKFTASYPKKAFDVSKSFNSVFAFEELVVIPTEALTAGVFSVSPTKKVYFSPGNLYAKKEGEIWSWHFYDEQYKYNSYQKDEYDDMIATADDNQIDLFTWGYGSWSTNPITEEYGSTFTDWGTRMGDGNTWYTLSSAEWQYLFSWDGTQGGQYDDLPGAADYTNDTRKGLYASGVTVCGKTNCIILYPDGFAGTKVGNGDTSSYDTEEEWTAAENAGVVCLPAAGYRDCGDISGEIMGYWSSTLFDENSACGVFAYNSSFYPYYPELICKQGCSVRLVADAPKLPEVPVESISLSKTELELIEGLSDSLTVTFTPAEATKKAVFWSSDNTSVATVDQTGKVSAVSVGTATITAVADGLAKASCAVMVKAATKGTAKRTGDINVNWVQLWAGGPKFAEYNVGANKAEDYGGYYAWGGSQDKVDDHNTLHITDNDNLTSTEDTATNLWGSNWRMPTADELGKWDYSESKYVDGLLGKCTCEWITLTDAEGQEVKDAGGNTVNGLLCTGKGAYASNSVFLPATGYYLDGGVDDQGSGYYWSSTPDVDECACDLSFSSGGQGVSQGGGRYCGFSVRAVLAEEE